MLGADLSFVHTGTPLCLPTLLFCFLLTDSNAAHWICAHRFRFRSWKWWLMCYMSYDVNLIFSRGQWFNLRFIFLYTLARSQDSVLNRLPATPRKQTPHSASLCCYSIFLQQLLCIEIGAGSAPNIKQSWGTSAVICKHYKWLKKFW